MQVGRIVFIEDGIVVVKTENQAFAFNEDKIVLTYPQWKVIRNGPLKAGSFMAIEHVGNEVQKAYPPEEIALDVLSMDEYANVRPGVRPVHKTPLTVDEAGIHFPGGAVVGEESRLLSDSFKRVSDAAE